MPTEMEERMDPLEREHSLCVVLPEGPKTNITVHGSKPVMDVLVMLCASYRLNLPDYTVEFLSPNKNNISFKPNSPIGSLEAEQIVLKPKGAEEKPKKLYVPEVTVRLLINYNTSHKTVLRVNPSLPLQLLLPAVCDKCEFNLETTILLRDSQSKESLDLTKSLNDYELREVFAQDTAAKDSDQPRTAETAVTSAEVISPPPLPDLPRREKKQKTRCFFSFLRRRRRKREARGPASAPASPGLGKRVGVGAKQASAASTDPPPAEMTKKRRAPPPPPPLGVSLSSCQVNGAQRSAESTLRSTKRRAPPPPPCANTPEEQSSHTEVGAESLDTLEELKETDESPHPSQPRPPHVHQVSDSFMPSFRGKDLSDARSALARVLTSSVSKGTLVSRLRNSAAFTTFQVSSCASLTPPCPDEGRVQSVLKLDLPVEGEWEDPVQRRGLTTFKVVPPNKAPPCDSEPTPTRPGSDLEQPDPDPAPEVSPEAENHETRTGGDQRCPGGSESPERSASLPRLCDVDLQNSSEEEEEEEVLSEATSGCSDGETSNSDGRRESVQSPGADLELCGSCTEEKKPEEEDVGFPPPPPPVFFYEEPEREASTTASPPAESTADGPGGAFREARGNDPTSTASQPTRSEPNPGPSRFAQAVATAVRRSRLQSSGKGSEPQASEGPHGRLPSPPRSTYQHGA